MGALSASRAALRRGGVPAHSAAGAGAMVVVLGLILGAVAVGVRIPGDAMLGGLPRLSQSDYSLRALDPLASVSEDYVRQVLGTVVNGVLAGELAVEIPDLEAPPGRPASPPAEEAEPAPTIEGEPGPIPGLAPGGWALTLAMVVDRSTVKAGDAFNYRMVIRNVGAEDFRGRSFGLQWHTPAGTFSDDSVSCELGPNGEDPCAGQRVLAPGLGDSQHEQSITTGVTIRPGEEWVRDWRVQTSPSATAGTQYTSHAHLEAGGRTITTDTVTVTVVE